MSSGALTLRLSPERMSNSSRIILDIGSHLPDLASLCQEITMPFEQMQPLGRL